MAKEIQIATDTAGQTLYAQIFRVTDGQVWNTAGTPAFENYATANIADYDVALTEQGTASKIYMGTFPTGITDPGTYSVRILIRAGGSPAETDTLAGIGVIHWDGSAVIDVASVYTSLATAKGATFDTSTDSLEAIRNRGDSAWVTATGFATASDMATALGYIDTEIADILADTNELQADWADGGRLDLILDARASQASVDGLNDLSAADVNAEVDAALADINLDHLVKIAVDTDFPTTVHLDSVIGHLADNGTTATFDRTTDSLEVIAATSGASAADIADAVWDEDLASHVGAGSTGEALNSTLRAADINGIAQATTAAIGLTIATGTIGATGNSTTSLHLTGLTFGDDELNNLLLVIYDVSESEYHARWITDWTATGDLATVATLPFTPQNSTDTYTILAVRQDVTGGSGPSAADIADAVWDEATAGHTTSGTFGEQLKTDVDAILADTNELQTDWVNGGRLDLILDARASQTSVDDIPTTAEFEARTIVAANYATAANLATVAGYLDTEIAAILEDTGTTIPAQISALNNLSAAQVNTEVDTALADANLDHLVKIAVDTDFATTVHLNSVIGHLVDNGTSATFDRTTDSQEAIRDRGDSAWATATGFSTHSASDVWAVGTRTLTAGTNIQLPSNGLANVTTWTVAITGNITGNLSGSVGSVTGAVGSVTGAVGSVAGAVGSVGGNVNGNVVGSVGSLAAQAQTDVRTATGLASANLDTQLGTIDDLLDTEVAAIKAKTDNLPSDPADQSAVEAAITAATSGLATQTSVNTIDDFLDTEIAAIKAKTDSLTFTTAGKVDAKLTSDGLDNLAVTAPSGVATTFREMVIQVWRRFFKKTVRNSTDGNIKTYADNGSTVVTTQTYTSASGVDTINEAS